MYFKRKLDASTLWQMWLTITLHLLTNEHWSTDLVSWIKETICCCWTSSHWMRWNKTKNKINGFSVHMVLLQTYKQYSQVLHVVAMLYLSKYFTSHLSQQFESVHHTMTHDLHINIPYLETSRYFLCSSLHRLLAIKKLNLPTDCG